MKTVTIDEGDVKKIYEAVLRSGGDCEGCEYNHVYLEYHPWGNTYVEEKLRECRISNITECPVVKEELCLQNK